MITTVTLNPCIDLTLYLNGFKTGGLNMVGRSRTDVAGKGLNVSVVLRAFGLSTMCLGVSFSQNGSQLYSYLEEQCIAHDFTVAHGSIRTNIKLLDTSKNEMTEVNSFGDPVEAHVIKDYFAKLLNHANRSSMLVFSGRVPNGGGTICFDDIYRRSLEAVKNLNVLTIVDAEKESLRQAVLAKPYLIKPNVFELETAFGCLIHSKKDIADACRDIIKKGVKVVCCSMGKDGAMIVDRKQAWYASPLDVEINGLQGAGDSLVAGICKAKHDNLGLDDMLRYGVAAASGSLTREGTLLCRKQDFEKLLPLVNIAPVI